VRPNERPEEIGSAGPSENQHWQGMDIKKKAIQGKKKPQVRLPRGVRKCGGGTRGLVKGMELEQKGVHLRGLWVRSDHLCTAGIYTVTVGRRELHRDGKKKIQNILGEIKKKGSKGEGWGGGAGLVDAKPIRFRGMTELTGVGRENVGCSVKRF